MSPADEKKTRFVLSLQSSHELLLQECKLFLHMFKGKSSSYVWSSKKMSMMSGVVSIFKCHLLNKLFSMNVETIVEIF